MSYIPQDPTIINIESMIHPMGAYSGATTYNIGDSVEYNGGSYLALVSTTGNLPTDTAYWQVLAEKGDTGDTGPEGPAGASGDHETLLNLQGGAVGEHYHLTSAKNTVVQNTTGTNSGNETAVTLGAIINGATAKTTPVDADMVGLIDSAASNVLKKLSWANIKATLKTYFDAIYTLTNLGGVPTSRTINGKSLANNVTLGLASSDFNNQGSAGNFLQGNAAGAPTWAPPPAGLPTVGYNSSAGISSTSSSTFQQKVRATFTPTTAGIWKIEFMCLTALSSSSSNLEFRIQDNDTTTFFTANYEPKDDEDDGEYQCHGGAFYATFTAAAHNIDLDYRSVDGATAYIKNAYIIATRLT